MGRFETRALSAGTREDFAALVEANNGVTTSPAFLFNGALSTFERADFKRERLIGKRKWVVTRTVRRSKTGASNSKRA